MLLPWLDHILCRISFRWFYSQIRCILRCAFANFEGYSVTSIIWVRGSINHNATHSPSMACKNKTENDSRLVGNSKGNRDDGWNFCREQEADIALSLQETRIRSEKPSKKTGQLLPKTGRLQATNHTNLETQEQTQWIEMHQSQVNMCFLRGPIGWLTEPGADYLEPPYVLYPWVNPVR